MSDLTTSGARAVKSGAIDPTVIIGVGQYALAYSVSGRGRELWRTDGTSEGTSLIARGNVPAIGYTFTRVGKRIFWITDAVYFIADDGRHGRELWRYAP